jgi:hypothetical protein
VSATPEPTPANLAQFIAHQVAGYDDEFDWNVIARVDGSTVTATVTAYDEHEVQAYPPVRFVVTVEQAS